MQVVLYSKPGCHLCEEAVRDIERLRAKGYDLAVEERDITTNQAWFDAYRYTIPVVEIAGRQIACPITADAIERLIHAAVS